MYSKIRVDRMILENHLTINCARMHVVLTFHRFTGATLPSPHARYITTVHQLRCVYPLVNDKEYIPLDADGLDFFRTPKPLDAEPVLDHDKAASCHTYFTVEKMHVTHTCIRIRFTDFKDLAYPPLPWSYRSREAHERRAQETGTGAYEDRTS